MSSKDSHLPMIKNEEDIKQQFKDNISQFSGGFLKYLNLATHNIKFIPENYHITDFNSNYGSKTDCKLLSLPELIICKIDFKNLPSVQAIRTDYQLPLRKWIRGKLQQTEPSKRIEFSEADKAVKQYLQDFRAFKECVYLNPKDIELSNKVNQEEQKEESSKEEASKDESFKEQEMQKEFTFKQQEEDKEVEPPSEVSELDEHLLSTKPQEVQISSLQQF